MAHSPSQRWEGGVLVERAISHEPNDEKEEVEPKATKPYKAPSTKRVAASENKAVSAAETKKPAKKKR